MSKTEQIQSLYAAFGRGDVTAILEQLTDSVDWNNSGVHSNEIPWNGNFTGKARVPAFFAAVAENAELPVFNPHTFIEGPDHVAVLLHIEGRVKKNGRPLINDVVHVWRFDDTGKIASYRHYNDTAMELAAWRG
jgi:ketosteroid isomerase-like protein